MAQLRGTTIISEDTALAVKQNNSTESFKIVTSSNSGSSLVSNVTNNLLNQNLKVIGESKFDSGIKLLKPSTTHYGHLYRDNNGYLIYEDENNTYKVLLGLNSSQNQGLFAGAEIEGGTAISARKLVSARDNTSPYTVGENKKSIVYFNAGIPVKSDETVGSNYYPIYLNKGVLTQANETVGSKTKPIFMSSGKITASDATVGSGNKLVYMSSGTITESNSTVGSIKKPVYLNSGTITALSDTVGSSKKPVYMNGGEITACTYSLNADFNGLGTSADKASKGTHTHSTSSTTFTVYYSDGTNGTVSVLTGVSTPNS